MAKTDKDHVRPDFSLKTTKADYDKAQKSIEKLNGEIEDLQKQIDEKKKEVATHGTVRYIPEGGFSNAAPAKEQAEANKATQEENKKTSTATKK